MYKWMQEAKANRRIPENFVGENRDLWLTCNQLKKEACAIDFDDMLIDFRRLLTEHEDAKKRFSDMYTHILVDEFQDNNSVQADIFLQMWELGANVTIVGDDDQCMYGF